MKLQAVLRRIDMATEEESKQILDAALSKRESFLKGGEIICYEYTKEEVKQVEELVQRTYGKIYRG